MSAFSILSGIGLTALMGGVLVNPAARRFVLGDIKQDWLFNELDFDHIDKEDQATVVNKDETCFRVFKLGGMLYESKNQDYQQNLSIGRSGAFAQIAENNVAMRIFGIKRQKETHLKAEWLTATLSDIGDREASLFKNSYNVEWFLVLSSKDRRKLIEASNKFQSLFVDYKISILKTPDDKNQACPLTSFLNYLITGEFSEDCFASYNNISANIRGCGLNFDKEHGLQTRTPNLNYHAVIAVKLWSEELAGSLVNRLMAVKGDIELCQILLPVSQDKTKILFESKRRQNMLGFFANEALEAEYKTAIDLMTEGNTALFKTQYQITLRSANSEDLDRLIQNIADILGRFRVVYNVESSSVPIYWFNRFPSHDRLLRPLLMFSDGVACLWAFSGSPTGMTRSPWDDRPVRRFPTPSGQTYNFQFHNSTKPQSLGHFLVFAPSGSGKSTLILHLLAGLAKMDRVRSYIFDSKEGTRFMVEAFGGQYQNFENLALNPLDVGEDTPSNRQAIRQVFLAMIGDLALTPAIEDEIDHAISNAFAVDPPERTLNQLFRTGFSKYEDARNHFSRWVVDHKGKAGIYHYIFNAPHDALAGFLSDNFMVGVNMNEALDDPALGPAIITHISQIISRTAAQNSRGFAIFVDEAAKLLQNEGFKNTVQEMFREYRKLNGVVGLAFQDPAALYNSGISSALLDNVSTMIFFPNPQGKFENYQAFNLQEEELDFILGGLGQEGGRRVLIIKRDAATDLQESAIIDIDLSPFGEALKYYRSGSDAIKLMETLKAKHGSEQWVNYL